MFWNLKMEESSFLSYNNCPLNCLVCKIKVYEFGNFCHLCRENYFLAKLTNECIECPENSDECKENTLSWFYFFFLFSREPI